MWELCCDWSFLILTLIQSVRTMEGHQMIKHNFRRCHCKNHPVLIQSAEGNFPKMFSLSYFLLRRHRPWEFTSSSWQIFAYFYDIFLYLHREEEIGWSWYMYDNGVIWVTVTLITINLIDTGLHESLLE